MKLLFLFIGILFSLSTQLRGTDAQDNRVETLLDALNYLVRFGYLEKLPSLLNANFLESSLDSLNDIDLEDPVNSILQIAFSKFQEFVKLPVTGKFDEATKSQMNAVRCGNKDVMKVELLKTLEDVVGRKKRFQRIGSYKWNKNPVSWRIINFSEGGFSPETTTKEIEQALHSWSNVTNLDFVQGPSYQTADIEFKFAKRAHQDNNAFDGRGQVLAHAYPPNSGIGGDVHFDDDEQWTSMTPYGQNFFAVVLHELGHALGLDHSDDPSAIMFPYAHDYTPGMKLLPDDIAGIQSIYGVRSGAPSATTQSPPVTTTTTKPIKTTTQGYQGGKGGLFGFLGIGGGHNHNGGFLGFLGKRGALIDY